MQDASARKASQLRKSLYHVTRRLPETSERKISYTEAIMLTERLYNDEKSERLNGSCEACETGEADHNWPEDRRTYVPNKEFKLSTSRSTFSLRQGDEK